MAQPRHTAFVSVSLTPEARDALRRLTIAASAATGRRMSMSEAITHTEQRLSRKGA